MPKRATPRSYTLGNATRGAAPSTSCRCPPPRHPGSASPPSPAPTSTGAPPSPPARSRRTVARSPSARRPLAPCCGPANTPPWAREQASPEQASVAGEALGDGPTPRRVVDDVAGAMAGGMRAVAVVERGRHAPAGIRAVREGRYQPIAGDVGAKLGEGLGEEPAGNPRPST